MTPEELMRTNPSFSPMYEHLRSGNKEIDNLYAANEIWSKKIKAKLKRKGHIKEANAAEAFGTYQEAVTQCDQIIEKIRKSTDKAEEKIRSTWTPKGTGIAILDARGAVEYLQGLGQEERQEALSESQELRQLVERFREVFGAGRIDDVLFDLEQSFFKSHLEELTDIKAVKKAIPDLANYYRGYLQDLFTVHGAISFDHSRELFESMYDPD